jgi:tetratricopeptide (TPR) repeat protein
MNQHQTPSLAILAALFVSQPITAAQLTRAQLEQYEQVGKRFGLTPQQVAEVYGVIEGRDSLIRSLSIEKKINLKAFRAISLELGLRNYGAKPEKLLEAIRARAADAAKYEQENAVLRKEVLTLKNSSDRPTVQAVLARADAAYASGDLDAAAQELSNLLDILSRPLEGEQRAYVSAVTAAMALATSRGDLETLDRLIQQSDTVLARLEKIARATRWQNQLKLPAALTERGARFGKTADFKEAARLYLSRVLPLVPKAEYPKEWAATQNALGAAILQQGQSSGGETGTALLAKALDIFNSTLSVRTKIDMPTDWAETQVNLGTVLFRQGERIAGNEGTQKLAQSVAAYEAALTVYTKANNPTSWATAHNNLGNVLSMQGERSDRESGLGLLGKAIIAYETALSARSKSASPSEWATTQTSLGTAYLRQGLQSGGEVEINNIAKAVSAYQAALTVHSYADAPARWAVIQTTLGVAFLRQSELTNNKAESVAILGKSVAALEAALTVRTKASAPADWALTKTNLATAFLRQGEKTDGEAGKMLLAKAILANEDVATVRTQSAAPAEWAVTQNNLGLALAALGSRTDGPSGLALLNKAAEAYEAALTVFDAENSNFQYQQATKNLSELREFISRRK